MLKIRLNFQTSIYRTWTSGLDGSSSYLLRGFWLDTISGWNWANQNQNCYWWHVQMTIIHQDLWWGKLVPSPYKRSELSNRVFCSFSSRKESICKWIPISNSLGKEAALVNVSISKGGLKCQRVVISDMPNWGDKVIRRYTGCTLQTFVKHYDSTISPPFFQRFPL